MFKRRIRTLTLLGLDTTPLIFEVNFIEIGKTDHLWQHKEENGSKREFSNPGNAKILAP